MPIALHSALWALAIVGFTALIVGLSLAGLYLGGAAANHLWVDGLVGKGLAVRALLPISGMVAGAGLGIGLGFLFANTRFITKG